MKIEKGILRCYPLVRTIVYNKRIIHIPISGCGSWRCSKCRIEKFEALKEAMILVFKKQWIYVGYFVQGLRRIDKWMKQRGRPSLKILMGETELRKKYMVISDSNFPSSIRKRRTTIFNEMKPFLFDQTVQAKLRKCIRNHKFTSILEDKLSYIFQTNDMYNSPSPSLQIYHNIKRLFQICLNINFNRILAHGWNVKEKLSKLESEWHRMSGTKKAEALNNLKGLLSITTHGENFIAGNNMMQIESPILKDLSVYKQPVVATGKGIECHETAEE